MRKIYWSRKGRRVVAAAAILLCIGAAAAFTIARGEEPGTYITYSATVGQGDTIWGIVSRIATNEDDLGALVFQTMRENGITNPGDLQPGQEIKVRVKARGASNHE